VAAVLARRDEIVNRLDDSEQVPWLESRGITLVRGEGRLDGERRVRVGVDLLIARDAMVIAVGSGALLPPIPGLAEASAWSNREITTAHEVPGRLLVLGGGVVGARWRRRGPRSAQRSKVIEALDRLLAREEPFAGEQVRDALEQRGVRVHTGTRAVAVAPDADGLTVALDDGTRVSGDRLLVAIGRKPLTDSLGLETVDLQGGGYVEVDDHMCVVGAPGLYAVGDVNGRSLLTHSGKYQARIAADHILGHPATAWADTRGAPRVVFTNPQVAAVGLTLEAAHAAGVEALAIDLLTSGTAGASFYGRGASGTTRFVVDKQREVLASVTFVGAEVADFLQAATIAVVGEVPLSRLAHAIAPFPTRSELWLKFVEAYEQQRDTTLHSAPGVAAGSPS